MISRVVRFPDPTTLAHSVAKRLLDQIVELQQRGSVNLCLTGGRTANLVYERLAELAPDSDLAPSKLRLWWGDERFVPTTDPLRNSMQALSRLARTIPLDPANIHMMAARDGRKDSDESAEEYAEELQDVVFDITLLGLGEDGHTGSIFPDHPSFAATNRKVIGVVDAPKEPPERITLTIGQLNRSEQVWFITTGKAKANAMARLLQYDPNLPPSYIHGQLATYYFIDEDAAAELPASFSCEL
ncbi:MAG: 6-phosphogluconolactonase [Arachnia propionica]|nr:MAG: 6-phosphogluconolactonase [Arachnia propionica]